VAIAFLSVVFPDLSKVDKDPYPDRESYAIRASDGVIPKLVQWNKGGWGPVLLVPGAGERAPNFVSI
jgi:hypothetical protein